MRKLLIIVDMQNDFIDGALANEEAQKIVTPMANLIKKWDGDIVFTRDTHGYEYMDTQEGKYLPVPHCTYLTDGWLINNLLITCVSTNDKCYSFVDKNTFGMLGWDGFLIDGITKPYDEIYMCGTCTDICVVSNALILKATFPETPIKIYSNLCAGTTKEKHKAALEVMRSCQCDIIEYNLSLEDNLND